MWRLCLGIVALRRRGHWPQGPLRYAPGPHEGGQPTLRPVPSGSGVPLAWAPSHGWSLCGAWPAAAVEQFALLKPLLDQPGAEPWLIGHLGQSLDGRIATSSGHSCFVTGAENLTHLHRLRALCDAVLVGAGTVASDDPQLTTRRVPGPHPVRVVLDPGLRTPAQVRVYTDAQAPTLLVCDARRRDDAAERVGAHQVLAIPGLCDEEGAMVLAAAVQALHARGLSVLFVEGGGVTISRFLSQGLLDRLHLAIAPVIIGEGRAGLSLPGARTMGDCARPACRVLAMGEDVLWDLDLRAARSAQVDDQSIEDSG